MKSAAHIISLANSKLTVAEFLLQHNYFDEAYYIGGYSLELLLKAKICNTLNITDFFDFDNSKSRRLPVSATKKGEKENLYKPYKVHDYEQLIILSGLYADFSNQIAADLAFKADWSIVSKWDENLRYSQGATQADTQSFIGSLKNIITWLQNYL